MTRMTALSSSLRKQLETAVLAGRRAAESASRAAIEGLGVFADRRPEHLNSEQASLRVGLRSKWRQLGDDRELLIAECAYEQWHRLLFARFLAENRLLLHPQFRAPVTLAECEELAPELGEPDGWSVAARFASEILPGIFRLKDPCVRLRLAPEGRHALEEILAGIPAEVFRADDALGWVYQFWQKDKKDEVNASERKIGGADLGPVTQLFTENYMVRFLLENSLGAWWAARHPDSWLVKGFDYLRFDDEGRPAAGSFEGWPDRVAEVTVMDPCCGSGHFLVEAFSMLWQMRVEEEALSPVEAQDAVLRDNLFGLELDPRCVQIAMMAVALQAWKAGDGWRELPTPNIACSGISVKAPVDEWKALAEGDGRLENALVRLHILFRDADTLGSLIDPKRATEITDPTGLQQSFDDVAWDEIAPLLEKAARRETSDPATAVLGADAASIARAADYLSTKFHLIATNPPFLGRGKQADLLRSFVDRSHESGAQDLATVFFHRSVGLLTDSGTVAFVLPDAWFFRVTYEGLREWFLSMCQPRFLVLLGEEAFWSFGTRGPRSALVTADNRLPVPSLPVYGLDLSAPSGVIQIPYEDKAPRLAEDRLHKASVSVFRLLPRKRMVFGLDPSGRTLGDFAVSNQGIKSGDDPRFRCFFWEVSVSDAGWRFAQGSPLSMGADGFHFCVRWGHEGELIARPQGRSAWGRRGLAMTVARELKPVEYLGTPFFSEVSAIVPRQGLAARPILAFGLSGELARLARVLDPGTMMRDSTFLDAPFDVDHWSQVAEERFPDGLPEPWSDDPTQWLFEGRPQASTAPLQVAVARLVGYRWPEQAESDDLDELGDADGIVCLPSVAGEAPAADRVQRVLMAAFGAGWSPGMVRRFLDESGSKKKNLADWLRDDFFKQHCAVFGNRPFVWHIWDGQRDGFSALVNYHRLDRRNLEKLTYTYLGTDWVERQRAGVRDEVPGAEARLAAALELQAKLEKILEGEAPLDIYVRWKELHEQPIGWEPDLDDGVRLNIRPFVEAGVLRSKFNIHWRKDRGKNPDGSERHNDVQLTIADKRTARQKAGKQ